MGLLSSLNLDYHVLLYQSQELKEKINIDTKTNLLKYRDDYLTNILKTASRVFDELYNKNYNLVLIRFDIDDFSAINTRFGHNTGDRILIDIAGILKEYSRPTDYVIRYGGEEFDVILPSTDLEGAHRYLKKIYKKVHSALEYLIDDTLLNVTVSAGVAPYSIPLKNIKHFENDNIRNQYLILQKQADDALYDAKASGKNQYRIHSDMNDYRALRIKYSERRHVHV
jgi:diguanylate cyclase (GGDEF)-like protein